MIKKLKKRFIVRKYIMATCASEAIKLEKKFKADDVWVDDKWIEQATRDNASAIGFSVERDNFEDY